MKKTLLTLAMALFGYSCYAQTNIFPSSGNVGIGTTSPVTSLHVIGGGVGYPATSGTTQSAGLVARLRDGSNLLLDMGGYAANGFWFQATDASNLGATYPILLNPNGGNVGIGTTSPSSKLAISGGDLQVEGGQGRFKGWYSAGSGRAVEVGISSSVGYIYNFDRTALTEGDLQIGGVTTGGITVKATTGNVGIGTTSPSYPLDVNGIIRSNGDSDKGLYISSSYNTTNNRNWAITNNYDAWGELAIVQSASNGSDPISGANPRLVIDVNGNVAIGATDPHNYKLAVNGSAIATSMTVKLYADWPDYVFKPAYHLPSLTTVKAYINKNQHLPEMPSEQQVKDNGINLGEIVKIQTKKIEELTLYAIDQQKQIELLKQEQQKSKRQEGRIAALEATLAKLTANK